MERRQIEILSFSIFLSFQFRKKINVERTWEKRKIPMHSSGYSLFIALFTPKIPYGSLEVCYFLESCCLWMNLTGIGTKEGHFKQAGNNYYLEISQKAFSTDFTFFERHYQMGTLNWDEQEIFYFKPEPSGRRCSSRSYHAL